MQTLLYDDFSGFSIGEFPYDRDHSATGEYHYVTPGGRRGVWRDQVVNFTWNGTGPTWIITEADGRHFMEQMRIEKNRPHRIFPTLQTGDAAWRDYTAEVTIRRISTKGMAGLAFCLHNSLDTLVFSLEEQKAVLSYRFKETVQVLAEALFEHDCDHEYRLRVQLDGVEAICSIDGKTLITYAGDLVQRGGKIALTADCPTQFAEVIVQVSDEAYAAIAESQADAAKKAAKAQAEQPKMKLWKKIDLHDFGTSRQIRFGHLTGGEDWYVVLAQAQKRVNRDAYAHISCLTAIDLDGNILWQHGEPSDNSAMLGKISADMPFQVYDIDGDGVDEVICAINFEIRILDGRTGMVKKRAPAPLADDEDSTVIGAPYNTYAFDRINLDGMRICNFSGKKRPSDLLVKDRYCRIYALDSDLNLLWKYKSPKNTGHFPLAVDVDGDGRDELLCGYTLLDSHGQMIWTYPIEHDHVDEIVAGKFMAGDDKGYFACVAGTEGFFIGDFHGNIVMRDYIGHAQRVSVGNYCPERPGFELAVSNFWGHQGIVYFYDSHGKPLWTLENELNGNLLTPVNWTGDGTDLLLTNADAVRGGLLNGEGVQAVVFPDDGHPVMCCEAIGLCGDARDELVVWDYHAMWIYTQEQNEGQNDYRPVKYPHRNASNYRGEYSFPDASYVTFEEDPRA